MTFLRFEIKSEAHDMMSDMKEGDVVVNRKQWLVAIIILT